MHPDRLTQRCLRIQTAHAGFMDKGEQEFTQLLITDGVECFGRDVLSSRRSRR